MSDEIERIAEGLSEARTKAIKDNDRSGIIPFLAWLVTLNGLSASLGYQTAFWFGLGAFISALIGLWKSGRNISVKEKAELEYLRAHLQEQSK